LLSKLNYLHVKLQNDIDDYNEMVKRSVLDYFDNENKTNPDFSDLMWKKDTVKILNYFKKDPYFKNKLSRYINALSNIQQVANDYRIESILMYKAIDSLTGRSTSKGISNLQTIPPEAMYKEYLGEYSDGKNSVLLSRNGENLMLGSLPLFWHEDHYFFNQNSFNIIKLYRINNAFYIKISNTNNETLLKQIPSK